MWKGGPVELKGPALFALIDTGKCLPELQLVLRQVH